MRAVMVNILIRDLNENLNKTLKVRAAQHGHTREIEIKAILKAAIIGKRPQKRLLADALMDIPKISSKINNEELFKRSDSPSRI